MATKEHAQDDATLGLYAEITIGPSTVNDITEETVSVIGKTFEGINTAIKKGVETVADTAIKAMQDRLLQQSSLIAQTSRDVVGMLKAGPIPTNDAGGLLSDIQAKIGQLNIGLANFMGALPTQPLNTMSNKELAPLIANNRALGDLLLGLQKISGAVVTAVSTQREIKADDKNPEMTALINQVKNLTIGTAELQRSLKEMPITLARNSMSAALQPLQQSTLHYQASDPELRSIVNRILESTSQTVTAEHKKMLNGLMSTYGHNLQEVLVRFTDAMAVETFKTLTGITTCFKTADKLLNSMGTIALAITPKGDVVAGSNYRLAKYDEEALRARNEDIDKILQTVHKSKDGAVSITTQEVIARAINAQTQEFTKCLRTELGAIGKERNAAFNDSYELCKACGGGSKYHGETTVLTDMAKKGISPVGSTMLVGGHFVSCDGCQAAMQKAGVASAIALQNPYRTLDAPDKWTRQAYAINKMQTEAQAIVRMLEKVEPERLGKLNLGSSSEEVLRNLTMAKKIAADKGLLTYTIQLEIDKADLDRASSRFAGLFAAKTTLAVSTALKDIDASLMSGMPLKITGIAEKQGKKAAIVELQENPVPRVIYIPLSKKEGKEYDVSQPVFDTPPKVSYFSDNNVTRAPLPSYYDKIAKQRDTSYGDVISFVSREFRTGDSSSRDGSTLPKQLLDLAYKVNNRYNLKGMEEGLVGLEAELHKRGKSDEEIVDVMGRLVAKVFKGFDKKDLEAAVSGKFLQSATGTFAYPSGAYAYVKNQLALKNGGEAFPTLSGRVNAQEEAIKPEIILKQLEAGTKRDLTITLDSNALKGIPLEYNIKLEPTIDAIGSTIADTTVKVLGTAVNHSIQGLVVELPKSLKQDKPSDKNTRLVYTIEKPGRKSFSDDWDLDIAGNYAFEMYGGEPPSIDRMKEVKSKLKPTQQDYDFGYGSLRDLKGEFSSRAIRALMREDYVINAYRVPKEDTVSDKYDEKIGFSKSRARIATVLPNYQYIEATDRDDFGGTEQSRPYYARIKNAPEPKEGDTLSSIIRPMFKLADIRSDIKSQRDYSSSGRGTYEYEANPVVSSLIDLENHVKKGFNPEYANIAILERYLGGIEAGFKVIFDKVPEAMTALGTAAKLAFKSIPDDVLDKNITEELSDTKFKLPHTDDGVYANKYGYSYSQQEAVSRGLLASPVKRRSGKPTMPTGDNIAFVPMSRKAGAPEDIDRLRTDMFTVFTPINEVELEDSAVESIVYRLEDAKTGKGPFITGLNSRDKTLSGKDKKLVELERLLLDTAKGLIPYGMPKNDEQIFAVNSIRDMDTFMGKDVLDEYFKLDYVINKYKVPTQKLDKDFNGETAFKRVDATLVDTINTVSKFEKALSLLPRIADKASFNNIRQATVTDQDTITSVLENLVGTSVSEFKESIANSYNLLVTADNTPFGVQSIASSLAALTEELFGQHIPSVATEIGKIAKLAYAKIPDASLSKLLASNAQRMSEGAIPTTDSGVYVDRNYNYDFLRNAASERGLLEYSSTDVPRPNMLAIPATVAMKELHSEVFKWTNVNPLGPFGGGIGIHSKESEEELKKAAEAYNKKLDGPNAFELFQKAQEKYGLLFTPGENDTKNAVPHRFTYPAQWARGISQGLLAGFDIDTIVGDFYAVIDKIISETTTKGSVLAKKEAFAGDLKSIATLLATTFAKREGALKNLRDVKIGATFNDIYDAAKNFYTDDREKFKSLGSLLNAINLLVGPLSKMKNDLLLKDREEENVLAKDIPDMLKGITAASSKIVLERPQFPRGRKNLPNLGIDEVDAKQLFMTVGVSGAGKTTAVREATKDLHPRYISADEFRRTWLQQKYGQDTRITESELAPEERDAMHAEIFPLMFEAIAKAYKNPKIKHIIVDNTNLLKVHRDAIRANAPEASYTYIVFDPKNVANIDAALELQQIRKSRTGRFVPKKVIEDQRDSYEPITDAEKGSDSIIEASTVKALESAKQFKNIPVIKSFAVPRGTVHENVKEPALQQFANTFGTSGRFDVLADYVEKFLAIKQDAKAPSWQLAKTQLLNIASERNQSEKWIAELTVILEGLGSIRPDLPIKRANLSTIKGSVTELTSETDATHDIVKRYLDTVRLEGRAQKDALAREEAYKQEEIIRNAAWAAAEKAAIENQPKPTPDNMLRSISDVKFSSIPGLEPKATAGYTAQMFRDVTANLTRQFLNIVETFKPILVAKARAVQKDSSPIGFSKERVESADDIMKWFNIEGATNNNLELNPDNLTIHDSYIQSEDLDSSYVELKDTLTDLETRIKSMNVTSPEHPLMVQLADTQKQMEIAEEAKNFLTAMDEAAHLKTVISEYSQGTNILDPTIFKEFNTDHLPADKAMAAFSALGSILPALLKIKQGMNKVKAGTQQLQQLSKSQQTMPTDIDVVLHSVGGLVENFNELVRLFNVINSALPDTYGVNNLDTFGLIAKNIDTIRAFNSLIQMRTVSTKFKTALPEVVPVTQVAPAPYLSKYEARDSVGTELKIPNKDVLDSISTAASLGYKNYIGLDVETNGRIMDNSSLPAFASADKTPKITHYGVFGADVREIVVGPMAEWYGYWQKLNTITEAELLKIEQYANEYFLRTKVRINYIPDPAEFLLYAVEKYMKVGNVTVTRGPSDFNAFETHIRALINTKAVTDPAVLDRLKTALQTLIEVKNPASGRSVDTIKLFNKVITYLNPALPGAAGTGSLDLSTQIMEPIFEGISGLVFHSPLSDAAAGLGEVISYGSLDKIERLLRPVNGEQPTNVQNYIRAALQKPIHQLADLLQKKSGLTMMDAKTFNANISAALQLVQTQIDDLLLQFPDIDSSKALGSALYTREQLQVANQNAANPVQLGFAKALAHGDISEAEYILHSSSKEFNDAITKMAEEVRNVYKSVGYRTQDSIAAQTGTVPDASNRDLYSKGTKYDLKAALQNTKFASFIHTLGIQQEKLKGNELDVVIDQLFEQLPTMLVDVDIDFTRRAIVNALQKITGLVSFPNYGQQENLVGFMNSLVFSKEAKTRRQESKTYPMEWANSPTAEVGLTDPSLLHVAQILSLNNLLEEEKKTNPNITYPQLLKIGEQKNIPHNEGLARQRAGIISENILTEFMGTIEELMVFLNVKMGIFEKGTSNMYGVGNFDQLIVHKASLATMIGEAKSTEFTNNPAYAAQTFLYGQTGFEVAFIKNALKDIGDFSKVHAETAKPEYAIQQETLRALRNLVALRTGKGDIEFEFRLLDQPQLNKLITDAMGLDAQVDVLSKMRAAGPYTGNDVSGPMAYNIADSLATLLFAKSKNFQGIERPSNLDAGKIAKMYVALGPNADTLAQDADVRKTAHQFKMFEGIGRSPQDIFGAMVGNLNDNYILSEVDTDRFKRVVSNFFKSLVDMSRDANDIVNTNLLSLEGAGLPLAETERYYTTKRAERLRLVQKYDPELASSIAVGKAQEQPVVSKLTNFLLDTVTDKDFIKEKTDVPVTGIDAALRNLGVTAQPAYKQLEAYPNNGLSLAQLNEAFNALIQSFITRFPSEALPPKVDAFKDVVQSVINKVPTPAVSQYSTELPPVSELYTQVRKFSPANPLGPTGGGRGIHSPEAEAEMAAAAELFNKQYDFITEALANRQPLNVPVSIPVSKMSQQEYAEHLKQVGLPQGVDAYEALTARPEKRGMTGQERMDDFLANQTAVRSFGGRITQLWESIAKQPLEGITAITSDNSQGWNNFKIGKDIASEGASTKAYITLNNMLDVTNKKLGAFLELLAGSGYSGQVKVPETGTKVLTSFDNIVMHGANETHTKIGEQLARQFFGEDVAQTQFGKDSGNKSHTELLAEEVNAAIANPAPKVSRPPVHEPEVIIETIVENNTSKNRVIEVKSSGGSGGSGSGSGSGSGGGLPPGGHIPSGGEFTEPYDRDPYGAREYRVTAANIGVGEELHGKSFESVKAKAKAAQDEIGRLTTILTSSMNVLFLDDAQKKLLNFSIELRTGAMGLETLKNLYAEYTTTTKKATSTDKRYEKELANNNELRAAIKAVTAEGGKPKESLVTELETSNTLLNAIDKNRTSLRSQAANQKATYEGVKADLEGRTGDVNPKDFYANFIRQGESIASEAAAAQRLELYKGHIDDLYKSVGPVKSTAHAIGVSDIESQFGVGKTSRVENILNQEQVVRGLTKEYTNLDTVVQASSSEQHKLFAANGDAVKLDIELVKTLETELTDLKARAKQEDRTLARTDLLPAQRLDAEGAKSKLDEAIVANLGLTEKALERITGALNGLNTKAKDAKASLVDAFKADHIQNLEKTINDIATALEVLDAKYAAGLMKKEDFVKRAQLQYQRATLLGNPYELKQAINDEHGIEDQSRGYMNSRGAAVEFKAIRERMKQQFGYSPDSTFSELQNDYSGILSRSTLGFSDKAKTGGAVRVDSIEQRLKELQDLEKRAINARNENQPDIVASLKIEWKSKKSEIDKAMQELKQYLDSEFVLSLDPKKRKEIYEQGLTDKLNPLQDRKRELEADKAAKVFTPEKNEELLKVNKDIAELTGKKYAQSILDTLKPVKSSLTGLTTNEWLNNNNFSEFATNKSPYAYMQEAAKSAMQGFAQTEAAGTPATDIISNIAQRTARINALQTALAKYEGVTDLSQKEQWKKNSLEFKLAAEKRSGYKEVADLPAALDQARADSLLPANVEKRLNDANEALRKGLEYERQMLETEISLGRATGDRAKRLSDINAQLEKMNVSSVKDEHARIDQSRTSLNSSATALEFKAIREAMKQQFGYSPEGSYATLQNTYAHALSGSMYDYGVTPVRKSTMATDSIEQRIKELQDYEKRIGDAKNAKLPALEASLVVEWKSKKAEIDTAMEDLKRYLAHDFILSLDPLKRKELYAQGLKDNLEPLNVRRRELEADQAAGVFSPEKHAELLKVNRAIGGLTGTTLAESIMAAIQPIKSPMSGLTGNEWLKNNNLGQFAQQRSPYEYMQEAARNAAQSYAQTEPSSANDIITRIAQRTANINALQTELDKFKGVRDLSPEQIKGKVTLESKIASERQAAHGDLGNLQATLDSAKGDSLLPANVATRISESVKALKEGLEYEKMMIEAEKALGIATGDRVKRLEEVNLLLAKMNGIGLADALLAQMHPTKNPLTGLRGLETAQATAQTYGMQDSGINFKIRAGDTAKAEIENLMKEYGNLESIMQGIQPTGLNRTLTEIAKNNAEIKMFEQNLKTVQETLAKPGMSTDKKLLDEERQLQDAIKQRIPLYDALWKASKAELDLLIQKEQGEKHLTDLAKDEATAKIKANELAINVARSQIEQGIDKKGNISRMAQLEKENAELAAAKTTPIKTKNQAGQNLNATDLAREHGVDLPGQRTGARGFAEQVMNMGVWWAEWTIGQKAAQVIPNALIAGIGFAKEFEAQMKNVELITQANGVQFEQLTNNIKELSNTRLFNPKELAEGLIILGQAGFNAAQSITLLPSITELATATLTSLKVAADITTTAIEAFNIPVERSSELSNTLAAITIESKLELTSLGTTFNYIAESAAAAGLSIEQTGTAMGIMSNAGVRASTIGTSLRSILGTLMAPTPKFMTELGKVGLSLDEVNPRYRELGQILNSLHDSGFDVQKAFEGLDKRIAGAITSLINNATEYDKFLPKITGTERASTMAAGQMDTFDAQTKRLRNETLLTGEEIFTPALMPAKELTGAVATIVHYINHMIHLIPESVRGWIGFTAAAGLSLSVVRSIGEGMKIIMGVKMGGNIGDAAKNLTALITDSKAAMATGPFKGVEGTHAQFLQIIESFLNPASLAMGAGIATAAVAGYLAVKELSGKGSVERAQTKAAESETYYLELKTLNSILTTANKSSLLYVETIDELAKKFGILSSEGLKFSLVLAEIRYRQDNLAKFREEARQPVNTWSRLTTFSDSSKKEQIRESADAQTNTLKALGIYYTGSDEEVYTAIKETKLADNDLAKQASQRTLRTRTEALSDPNVLKNMFNESRENVLKLTAERTKIENIDAMLEEVQTRATMHFKGTSEEPAKNIAASIRALSPEAAQYMAGNLAGYGPLGFLNRGSDEDIIYRYSQYMKNKATLAKGGTIPSRGDGPDNDPTKLVKKFDALYKGASVEELAEKESAAASEYLYYKGEVEGRGITYSGAQIQIVKEMIKAKKELDDIQLRLNKTTDPALVAIYTDQLDAQEKTIKRLVRQGGTLLQLKLPGFGDMEGIPAGVIQSLERFIILINAGVNSRMNPTQIFEQQMQNTVQLKGVFASDLPELTDKVQGIRDKYEKILAQSALGRKKSKDGRAGSIDSEVYIAIQARMDLEIQDTVDATIQAGWARIEPKMQKIQLVLQDMMRARQIQLEIGFDIRKADINVAAAKATLDYLETDKPKAYPIMYGGISTVTGTGTFYNDTLVSKEGVSPRYDALGRYSDTDLASMGIPTSSAAKGYQGAADYYLAQIKETRLLPGQGELPSFFKMGGGEDFNTSFSNLSRRMPEVFRGGKDTLKEFNINADKEQALILAEFQFAQDRFKNKQSTALTGYLEDTKLYTGMFNVPATAKPYSFDLFGKIDTATELNQKQIAVDALKYLKTTVPVKERKFEQLTYLGGAYRSETGLMQQTKAEGPIVPDVSAAGPTVVALSDKEKARFEQFGATIPKPKLAPSITGDAVKGEIRKIGEYSWTNLIPTGFLETTKDAFTNIPAKAKSIEDLLQLASSGASMDMLGSINKADELFKEKRAPLAEVIKNNRQALVDAALLKGQTEDVTLPPEARAVAKVNLDKVNLGVIEETLKSAEERLNTLDTTVGQKIIDRRKAVLTASLDNQKEYIVSISNLLQREATIQRSAAEQVEAIRQYRSQVRERGMKIQEAFAKGAGVWQEPTGSEKESKMNNMYSEASDALKAGRLDEAKRLYAKFEELATALASDPNVSEKDKKSAGWRASKNIGAFNTDLAALEKQQTQIAVDRMSPVQAAIKAEAEKLKPQVEASMANFGSLNAEDKKKALANLERLQAAEKFGNMSAEDAAKASIDQTNIALFDKERPDMEKFSQGIDKFVTALDSFVAKFGDTSKGAEPKKPEIKADAAGQVALDNAVVFKVEAMPNQLFDLRVTQVLTKEVTGLPG